MDDAAAAMQDMDVVSLAKNSQSMASKLRVDLDLPTEAYDDLKLGEGIYLPEWDYKKQILKKDYCCLQPMLARDAVAGELPAHLKSSARKLRNQFEALKPSRIWFKAQQDGTHIEMDAYLNFHVNQHTQHHDPESRLYKAMKNSHRDMASLLLAVLSLSTDSWINNSARTIDVIRDSLYLFAESLTATGDRFAIHGFSSRNRNHVRFNIIKNFEDSYNANIRGRIQAIRLAARDGQVLHDDKLPFERFHEAVQRGRVNLAPLEATPFTRCKSALKVIEAGCFGIPTVISPLPDAERFADAGAMIAGGAAAWEAALERLLFDDAAYAAATDGLAERVRARADIDRIAADWLAAAWESADAA